MNRKPTFNEPMIIQNAYDNGKQIWDERMGSLHSQLSNWRMTTLILLIVVTVLAGAVVVLIQQNKVVPYIVEIDNKGTIQKVSPAETQNYRPDKKIIRFMLADLITKFRQKSSDIIVLRENLVDLYYFLAGSARKSISDYAQRESPFQNIGSETRSVAIISVNGVSKDSYQIRWVEKTFQKGKLTDKSNYTAIVTIGFKNPDNETKIRKNPLGLYLTDITWSKDLKQGD